MADAIDGLSMGVDDLDARLPHAGVRLLQQARGALEVEAVVGDAHVVVEGEDVVVVLAHLLRRRHVAPEGRLVPGQVGDAREAARRSAASSPPWPPPPAPPPSQQPPAASASALLRSKRLTISLSPGYRSHALRSVPSSRALASEGRHDDDVSPRMRGAAPAARARRARARRRRPRRRRPTRRRRRRSSCPSAWRTARRPSRCRARSKRSAAARRGALRPCNGGPNRCTRRTTRRSTRR